MGKAERLSDRRPETCETPEPHEPDQWGKMRPKGEAQKKTDKRNESHLPGSNKAPP